MIGAVFCVDVITLYNLKKRYAFFSKKYFFNKKLINKRLDTKETNGFVSSSESRKRKLDVGFFVQVKAMHKTLTK